MAQKLLTKRKANWAKGRDVTLRGTPLIVNASLQAKYVRALKKLTLQMTKETKEQVAKLFRGELADNYFTIQKEAASAVAMDASLTSQAKKLMNKLTAKFTQLFNSSASSLAERMLNGTLTSTSTTLHTSLKQLSGGLSLKTGVVPSGMEDVSKSIVNENVQLIKSIPQEYLNDVSGAVFRSITTGAGIATLIPELSKYAGISDRRVKLMALDQTRKAYNTIAKQKMINIGVGQFEWLHSAGGQKPRQSHIAMTGNVYSFDDLPIINQEQVDRGYEAPERGIPGQAINCRCKMIPVIPLDSED
jgi:SPP1 gp7 family putative phage head morphogenesis protein